MFRDMSLIGILRYLPLAQFTKARPVDSLGPFSLASLETCFVMAPDCQRPVVAPCTQTTQGCTRVPVRLFESPRHSGATEEGVTPRLLRISLPGVPEDRRPMKIQPRPAGWHRRRSLRLTRKVRSPAVRSKLGLGKLTCKRR